MHQWPDDATHGAIGGVGTVLGMEWAGEVLAVGANVSHVRVGDRVMGSGRGALAEQAVTDRGRVLPWPNDGLGFEQAATLPVALQTLHDALVTNGRLRTGQSVLIQGAASGVGLMGLRMAKVLGARLVIGTSRDAARRARLAEFGADLALDTNDPAWPERVLNATDGRGVDLLVDMLSGSTVDGSLQATAIGGRIVAVADVFDALTHARPYKTAWRLDDAIDEIKHQSGTKFDPTVVKAFLHVVAQYVSLDEVELETAYTELRPQLSAAVAA